MTITPAKVSPSVEGSSPEKKPLAFEAAIKRAISALKSPTGEVPAKPAVVLTASNSNASPAPNAPPAELSDTGVKVFDKSSIKQLDSTGGASSAANTDLIDNSKYATDAKDWDTIVGNTGAAPTQEEKDLNRPRAASRMLADNWDNWGLHGAAIDFANPPSTLPPEAQACLKYVASSPTLMAALDAGGGAGPRITQAKTGLDGKTNNVITRAEVTAFANQADSDLSAASSAYSKFLGSNPGATPLAKENAKTAAIVMANITLVGSAGAEMQGDNRRTVDGSLDTSNMNAVEGDAGLSKTLTGAAGYWSGAGMFRTLEIAGDNPATVSADGIAQQHNFSSWLEKQAPADDHGVLMMLSNGAARDSVASVDTSTLTKDVLDHPEKYDGRTKAAVLTEISDARVRLSLSANPADGSDLFTNLASDGRGINPSKAKVTADLDGAIQTLSADKDVQAFFAQNQGAGMSAIVNADPAMKTALQSYQDTEISSGNILNNNLERKDADGKSLSMTDALIMSGTDATLTHQALGGTGDVDMVAVAQHAGKSEQIEQYFRENVLTGKDLDTALAQDREANGDKADPMAVVAKFSQGATYYKAFLGEKITPAESDTLRELVRQKVSDSLLDSAGQGVMADTFGDANGNFDEAKTKEIVDKALADNPDMFKDSTGQAIAPADVVSLIRSSWDLGRQGEKISDVMPKAIDGIKSTASTAYKQGLLHVGSSLLAGAVLIARSATGSNNQAENSLRLSSGMQAAGLMMEGSAKYAKENNAGKIGSLSPENVTKLANAGKVLGGAGSFVGGVFGIISGVDSAFSGDKLNAGFSLTSGVLSTGAAVASIIEGAAGFFVGGSAATATSGFAATADVIVSVSGATAGVLGWAAAGAGAIASIVGPLVIITKREGEQNNFYNGLTPTLEKYSLTGGPKEEGDYENQYPLG